MHRGLFWRNKKLSNEMPYRAVKRILPIPVSLVSLRFHQVSLGPLITYILQIIIPSVLRTKSLLIPPENVQQEQRQQALRVGLGQAQLRQ